jgi:hypothetical protein
MNISLNCLFRKKVLRERRPAAAGIVMLAARNIGQDRTLIGTPLDLRSQTQQSVDEKHLGWAWNCVSSHKPT